MKTTFRLSGENGNRSRSDRVRRLLAALITVPSLCGAATLTGSHVVVDYSVIYSASESDSDVTGSGDGVVWDVNAVSKTFPYLGQSNLGEYAAEFSFAALPGYVITGYDIQYDLSFATASYVVTGLEERYSGPIGSTVGGAASFVRLFGSDNFSVPAGFQGPEWNESRTVQEFVAGPDFPSYFYGYVRAHGLIAPCYDYGPTHNNCGGEASLYTEVALSRATISPRVVAAIPEPETYALLMAGFLAVSAVVRRRKGRRP